MSEMIDHFKRWFRKDQIAIPHGTITRYSNYGCRCNACTEATEPMTSKVDTFINPHSGYKPVNLENIEEVAPPRETGVLTSARWGKSSFGFG